MFSGMGLQESVKSHLKDVLRTMDALPDRGFSHGAADNVSKALEKHLALSRPKFRFEERKGKRRSINTQDPTSRKSQPRDYIDVTVPFDGSSTYLTLKPKEAPHKISGKNEVSEAIFTFPDDENLEIALDEMMKQVEENLDVFEKNLPRPRMRRERSLSPG